MQLAKLGVAYRTQPIHAPGPGDYRDDEGHGISGGAFDGTGRLLMSRSSPSFTLVSRVPMAKVTGKPFIVPEAGTYFPTPTYASETSKKS